MAVCDQIYILVYYHYYSCYYYIIILDNDGWLNLNFYEGEHEGVVQKAIRTLLLSMPPGAEFAISTNSINRLGLRSVFTAR
jgi:hypothetical protein